MPLKSNKYFPLAIYGLLAILVLGPLMGSGYILTFDMVFVPHLPLPSYSGIDYPLWALIHYASAILPGWFIQKVLLVSILAGGGYGAHRMVGTLRPRYVDSDWHWACYFGGVFYTINPFVYARFMAGQYMVLLGYALLPYVFMTLWRAVSRPSIAQGAKTALWLVLLGIVSVHALAFAAVIGSVVLALWLYRYRFDRDWLVRLARCTLTSGATWLAASLYWIIPLAMGQSHAAQTVSGFGIGDLRAFSTVPGHLGLIGNVLALQGFWGDTRNLYLLPQDMLGWWWIWLPVLALLVVSGVMWSWRQQKGMCILFGSLVVAGCVLAIGSSGTVFAPAARWFFEHSTLARAYREPQKWVAVIVLGYAYLGGTGLYALLRQIRTRKLSEEVRRVAIICALGMGMISAPLMLFGFHGQLRTTSYPADWYNVRSYLQKQGDPKVLFLPWHLYMRYDFAHRVAASPAQKFFGVDVISSSDPEMAGASPYAQTYLQRQILSPLSHSLRGDRLATNHVHYVLVAKEYDWRRYDFLNTDPLLQVVKDTPTMRLYKVKGAI